MWVDTPYIDRLQYRMKSYAVIMNLFPSIMWAKKLEGFCNYRLLIHRNENKAHRRYLIHNKFFGRRMSKCDRDKGHENKVTNSYSEESHIQTDTTEYGTGNCGVCNFYQRPEVENGGRNEQKLTLHCSENNILSVNFNNRLNSISVGSKIAHCT